MSSNTNAANLVDITTVSVDKNLPQPERIAEFRRQIGDTRNYKCTAGDETFTVRAVYADNGTSIESCLRGMMA